jgi:hypothetical protein
LAGRERRCCNGRGPPIPTRFADADSDHGLRTDASAQSTQFARLPPRISRLRHRPCIACESTTWAFSALTSGHSCWHWWLCLVNASLPRWAFADRVSAWPVMAGVTSSFPVASSFPIALLRSHSPIAPYLLLRTFSHVYSPPQSRDRCAIESRSRLSFISITVSVHIYCLSRDLEGES